MKTVRWILTWESRLVTVVAQFNPKEVSVDRSVPWQKQKKGPAHLEFTAGEPKTMSFELMFDTFNTSVEIEIDNLHKLADVVQALRRPPRVKVIWGAPGDSAALDDEVGGGISSFQAVIESVAVKHTTVTPDGKVVRATANVKFKEAANFKVGTEH